MMMHSTAGCSLTPDLTLPQEKPQLWMNGDQMEDSVEAAHNVEMADNVEQ